MTRWEKAGAIFVLVCTSPLDWPLMVLKEGLRPHPPQLDDISPGGWYHKAKGFWSECFRRDAEYWSKLCRFLVWWLIVGHILREAMT